LLVLGWDIGGRLDGFLGELEGVVISILVLEGIDDGLGDRSPVFTPLSILKVILEGPLLRGASVEFFPVCREHTAIIN
jgi:hypothetical protein